MSDFIETNADIWNKPPFQELSIHGKLLYFFVCIYENSYFDRNFGARKLNWPLKHINNIFKELEKANLVGERSAEDWPWVERFED